MVGDGAVNTADDAGSVDHRQRYRRLFVHHLIGLALCVSDGACFGAALQVYASEPDGDALYFGADRGPRIYQWH